MDYIMFSIVIMLLAGLGMLVYSMFMKDTSEDKRTADADKAIDELNNLSKDVFSEFDEKYKELLFLYEMVDAKKNDANAEVRKAAESAKDKMAAVISPKYDQISELKANGMSVAQIAKQLNMGQGEVQLIMNLGKKR